MYHYNKEVAFHIVIIMWRREQRLHCAYQRCETCHGTSSEITHIRLHDPFYIDPIIHSLIVLYNEGTGMNYVMI